MDKKNRLLDKYVLDVNGIKVDIEIIYDDNEPVPLYLVNITNITESTKIVLEKIREEFISKLNFDELERTKEDYGDLKERFKKSISDLVDKYFPTSSPRTKSTLINYLLEENLGLGKIDILLKDKRLEEVVINNHKEPVQVYHGKFGWLKTNIRVMTEDRIRHYATMIGRDVNKEITSLNPLMDAHLLTGDRVNATLSPISDKGNTITIRKFAEDPWTITKFIEANTISYSAAALIWLAMQNEMSILISGGTGSGKTSMLNVVSNFLPPNQRIVSIEDTREIELPDQLHWVPMTTRLPNPEGKGGVSMLDLLVNSLRMRPDRIIVGEIRREKEAQVLLEAVHTGHSVYATIHANTAEETITRLTSPPINLPKKMVSSIQLIVVQNRNRRTGVRRTLQVAEVTDDGDARVILQHNAKSNTLEQVSESKRLMSMISLYTGASAEEIKKDLKQKQAVLKWLVENKVQDIDDIGKVMTKYYTGQIKLVKEK